MQNPVSSRLITGRSDGRLNAEAYKKLRNDIISCELPPGASVSESQLSVRYGIGKAPIRNALARTIQEGLIINNGRQGHAVSSITLRDVREVYQIRKLLEPAAAGRAAGRVDCELLQRIDANCQVNYEPGDRAGQLAYVRTNRDFHICIAKAAGNSRLVAYISQLQDTVMRFCYLSIRLSAEPPPWQHDHREILAALSGNDSAGAEALMLEHLQAGERKAMATMLELPDLWDVNLGGHNR